MTATRAARPQPRHHGGLLIVLLVATLVLAGGAQTLAPTPAAAMIDQGEECTDPILECEPGGGGGVGSSGGGGSPNDTVGSETIEVRGTRPSPCQLSPSSCLPSSGRPPLGSNGARNPLRPRGGRPMRVADANPGLPKRCRGALRRLSMALKDREALEGKHRQERGVWLSEAAEELRARDELRRVLGEAASGRTRYGLDEIAAIRMELSEVEQGIASKAKALDQAHSTSEFSRLNALEKAVAAAKDAASACLQKVDRPPASGLDLVS
jgi:hypothetical protein